MARILAGVLLAGFLLVAAGGQSAGAATPTNLSISTYGRIVVDPTSSRVFVSGGDSIVVLDLNGNIVKTITGETGADAMVVLGSNLYVATTTSIDRIDTGTLTVTSPWVPGLNRPLDLAYANRMLWTTTGACGGATVQLASIDPTASTPAATTYPLAFTATNHLAGCARFATNHASNPGFLMAWSLDSDSPLFTTFDVSSGSPVQQLSVVENAGSGGVLSNVQDVVVTPDGSHIIVAPGAPYQFYEYGSPT